MVRHPHGRRTMNARSQHKDVPTVASVPLEGELWTFDGTIRKDGFSDSRRGTSSTCIKTRKTRAKTLRSDGMKRPPVLTRSHL